MKRILTLKAFVLAVVCITTLPNICWGQVNEEMGRKSIIIIRNKKLVKLVSALREFRSYDPNLYCYDVVIERVGKDDWIGFYPHTEFTGNKIPSMACKIGIEYKIDKTGKILDKKFIKY